MLSARYAMVVIISWMKNQEREEEILTDDMRAEEPKCDFAKRQNKKQKALAAISIR